MSLFTEIAKIVKQSSPSCGLKKACYTNCDECGAERIIALLLVEIEKLESFPFKTPSQRKGYETFRQDIRRLLEEK